MRTRSMSVAGAPSDSPKSSVARRCPPSSGLTRIITRSISKNLDKRKSCLLPLTCPSLAASLSGCPRIQNMLKKQHQSVLDYINRDRTGEPKGFCSIDPNIHVIHGKPKRFSDDDHHQDLVQLGVVFRGQSHPLARRKVKQAKKEYEKQSQATLIKKNLTDKSLVTIKNSCHGLESLDIARCERVGDDGVIYSYC